MARGRQVFFFALRLAVQAQRLTPLVGGAFAIVAALLLVAAARSDADPTIAVPVTPTGAVGPPVEIDECKLLYSGNDVAGESSGIFLKFTNDSTMTADLINFKITAGSESGMIRDVGTFTPGIEITHHYREGSGHLMFSPLLSHVALDCSVASVHFKNGSVWQASSVKPADPAPSPIPVVIAPKRPLDLAPSSLDFPGAGSQYARYLSLYDAVGLGTVHQSGTCAGVVSIRTIEMSRRSAALRVSPLSQGRCSITIGDAASNSVIIPVLVEGTRAANVSVSKL